jgi:hypothetical protein
VAQLLKSAMIRIKWRMRTRHLHIIVGRKLGFKEY